MNTLSNERLEEKLHACEQYHFAHQAPINVKELREVLQELLALRKEREAAVPVILYRERNPYNGLTTGWQELTEQECEFVKANAGDNAEFCTLYAVPPAQPVAVPDLLIAELLEIAKNAADEADKCAFFEHNDESERHSKAIADWQLRAAMLQPSQWIPCSERMPEEHNFDIWVFSPTKGVNDGVAWDGAEFVDDECLFRIVDATHWMKKEYPAAPGKEG